MQDLGTLGGTQSTGTSINNAGQVTGYSTTATGATHAFFYSNGTMTDLGSLGFDSFGEGINSEGEVTGYAYTSSGSDPHAFVYRDGALLDLNSLIDPSTPLPSDITLEEGQGINDEGWIVADGIDRGTGEQEAYLLTPVPLNPGVWLFASGLCLLCVVTRGRGRTSADRKRSHTGRIDDGPTAG